MSTIKNQRCFTEATASARLILATGLHVKIRHWKELTNNMTKRRLWSRDKNGSVCQVCVCVCVCVCSLSNDKVKVEITLLI